MSTAELKKRLIDKIEQTDNIKLLEDAYRLLALETMDIEIYKLSDDQKIAVKEAREEYKAGKYLTDEQVNKEIDEWLSE